MQSFSVIPGVPAAGHLAHGYWHPGDVITCPRCTRHEQARRRIVKYAKYRR